MKKNKHSALSLLFLPFILIGCGGGGSSNDVAIIDHAVKCWDGTTATSKVSEKDYSVCPAMTDVSVELKAPDTFILHLPDGVVPSSGNLAIGPNGKTATVQLSAKNTYYGSTCDKTLFNPSTSLAVTGTINFNNAPSIKINTTVTPTAPLPVSFISSGENTYGKIVTLTVTGDRVNTATTFGNFCDTLVQQTGGTCQKRVFTCTVNQVGDNLTVNAQLVNKTIGSISNVSVPNPQVVMHVTSTDPAIDGDMTMELYPAKAPITVKNFLKYINAKFYDGTVIHRIVTKDIKIVQGGGFTYANSTFTSKAATYSAINMEAPSTTGLKNVANTIAMARTSDKNSATSQFFFNQSDNPSFDTDSNPYAVFGKVTNEDGISILGKMIEAKTNLSDQPITPINLTTAKQTR